eukprot:1386096-Rhodomonas_salina.1
MAGRRRGGKCWERGGLHTCRLPQMSPNRAGENTRTACEPAQSFTASTAVNLPCAAMAGRFFAKRVETSNSSAKRIAGHAVSAPARSADSTLADEQLIQWVMEFTCAEETGSAHALIAEAREGRQCLCHWR